MIRWFISVILGFIANAIGLWVTSLFLEGFEITGTSFIIAVVIFTVCTAILGPFISKMAFTRASFLMGGIGLVNTFVALLVTSLISDGVMISGINTWLIATVMVWFFSMIGNVILPLIIFKMILDKRRSSKPQSSPPQPEQ